MSFKTICLYRSFDHCHMAMHRFFWFNRSMTSKDHVAISHHGPGGRTLIKLFVLPLEDARDYYNGLLESGCHKGCSNVETITDPSGHSPAYANAIELLKTRSKL